MSIYKFYEKFNHKNIHFIVNSIATKNELKKINKKKYLLYNCFKILDKNNYKLFSAIREKSKTFNICIISSNDPRKGLINFFEVAKNFASSRKFQFHIFGETTEYLKNLFCKFEKPENVILRGYVPNPCKTIKDLHLLLSVSEFHESFGRTIVEAFSVGIPVIGNNKGALPELIISNFNGFNCLSIEDICKKIIFLNTLNNYKEFSKNAYKSSLRFDEKLFKIKLNQIVSKLI
jgi:glycosyltransferase involved in cell wall biosynthesis